MQMQTEPSQTVVSKGQLLQRRVEDHHYMRIGAIILAIGIQLHHDHARYLARARIQEAQILLNLPEGRHAK